MGYNKFFRISTSMVSRLLFLLVIVALPLTLLLATHTQVFQQQASTYGSCTGSQGQGTCADSCSTPVMYSSPKGNPGNACGRNTAGQSGTVYCCAPQPASGGSGGSGNSCTVARTYPECTNSGSYCAKFYGTNHLVVVTQYNNCPNRPYACADQGKSCGSTGGSTPTPGSIGKGSGGGTSANGKNCGPLVGTTIGHCAPDSAVCSNAYPGTTSIYKDTAACLSQNGNQPGYQCCYPNASSGPSSGSGGNQCGNCSGTCSSNGQFCEKPTGTCSGIKPVVAVSKCVNGSWAFQYNQNGGACAASSCNSGAPACTSLLASCAATCTAGNTRNGTGCTGSTPVCCATPQTNGGPGQGGSCSVAAGSGQCASASNPVCSSGSFNDSSCTSGICCVQVKNLPSCDSVGGFCGGGNGGSTCQNGSTYKAALCAGQTSIVPNGGNGSICCVGPNSTGNGGNGTTTTQSCTHSNSGTSDNGLCATNQNPSAFLNACPGNTLAETGDINQCRTCCVNNPSGKNGPGASCSVSNVGSGTCSASNNPQSCPNSSAYTVSSSMCSTTNCCVNTSINTCLCLTGNQFAASPNNKYICTLTSHGNTACAVWQQCNGGNYPPCSDMPCSCTGAWGTVPTNYQCTAGNGSVYTGTCSANNECVGNVTGGNPCGPIPVLQPPPNPWRGLPFGLSSSVSLQGSAQKSYSVLLNNHQISSALLASSKRVLAAQVIVIKGTATYDPSSGQFFDTAFSLINVPAGQYDIILHVDGYLDKRLIPTDGSNAFTISYGQPFSFIPVSLIPGDIAPGPHGDNFIDILDYNKLVSCLGQSPTGTCQQADLNNDGKIDQTDLQILQNGFGTLGDSFNTPQFTCISDPSCNSGNNNLQLCSLLCTKQ